MGIAGDRADAHHRERRRYCSILGHRDGSVTARYRPGERARNVVQLAAGIVGLSHFFLMDLHSIDKVLYYTHAKSTMCGI